MRFLLVGHKAARTTLAQLIRALRNGGVSVSGYFDDDLDLVNENRGFPETDFLILGLNADSRNPTSKAFEVERDLLIRATSLRIPCGVVCDEHGHISSPYLVELGSRVKLVITRTQNDACNPTELCENAVPLYLPDFVSGAAIIVTTVEDILNPKKPKKRIRA